jgi:hypothetical protein
MTRRITKSLLYAVITTDDETHAIIYADGSFRIKWASGGITQGVNKETATK